VQRFAAENRTYCTANTEPGSSGSPCFNSELDLIAIHHFGANPNRGVRLASVLDFLRERRLELEAKGLGSLIG